MADQEISALTELAAQPANDDLLVIVDTSDTTQAPTGTTKKIQASNVRAGLALSGAVTGTGITQSTNRLLGRSTAGTGAIEEITPTSAFQLVSGVLRFIETIGVACSDETTALTTGNGKATFHAPFAFTLTNVRATVNTAPTDANIIVDVNEAGSSVLSTLVTIEATETSSATATTQPVISDAAIADDAIIRIDLDQIGSTIAGAGLKVWLYGYRS